MSQATQQLFVTADELEQLHQANTSSVESERVFGIYSTCRDLFGQALADRLLFKKTCVTVVDVVEGDRLKPVFSK